jgi:hypothetical protein
MLELGVVMFFAGMTLGIALVCGPSYRRGVVEGYGYHAEPRNVEFMKAGTYLRDHCWERFPQLRTENQVRIHRDTQYHEKWEDN